jgi:anti-anti-sigma factor
MLIEIEHGYEVCILRLSGRFLSGEEPGYASHKADEITSHDCNNMLVDLRELRSIGSMGIGFVVGVYISVTKRSRGRFVLVGANRRVREVLDLTRLSTIIPLATDLPSGLAALRDEGPAARSAGKG